MTRTAILLVSAVATLSAQSQQGQRTFRTGVTYIEVDVFVTDRDGSFVRGLGQDDFDLREDGRLQTIADLRFVDLPVERRPPQRAPEIDADVATNAGQRRVYVLLLEPLMRQRDVAAIRQAQNVALRFVDEALGPGDMMAVIHPQGSRSHAQAFTADKRLLRASIDDLSRSVLIADSGHCDGTRLRNTYLAIEDIATRLGAISGRRKAILWIGGRIGVDYVAECGDIGKPLQFWHRDAIRAATRNNVAIYPVDPLGNTPEPSPPAAMNGWVPSVPPLANPLTLNGLAALRSVAEDTGGLAVVNTNRFSPAFEEIVRDNSTYYLLGYYPDTEWRDGQFHEIQVRVKRPGLTVRARRGYYAPDAASPERPATTAASALPSPVQQALRSPLPTAGLTLEMVATPFKGQGPRGSVLLGARLHGGDLTLDADDRVEVAHLIIDTQGTVTVGARKTFTLNLRETTRAAAAAGGMHYFDRLDLPPGRHEIRLAAHQPGGATGAVVTHVEVPDFAQEPLVLSGIVLASTGATGDQVLHGDAALRDILAAEPTARRRFGRGETLAAYAEVYQRDPRARDEVRLRATLAPAGKSGVPAETPRRVAGDGDRAGYLVRLPLAGLAPGDYVLTMEAQAGRRKASRQVRLAVE